MGPLPWTVRIRLWLAYTVILNVLYFVAGERPLFCDLATSGCPLEQPADEETP